MHQSVRRLRAMEERKEPAQSREREREKKKEMGTRINGDDESERKRRRLVLVPFPTQGHVTPVLQLAAILHSTGSFSITIAHSLFNSPDASSHPNFRFLPIADGLTDSDVSDGNVMALIASINASCRSLLRDSLLKSEYESSCVIYDGLMYFAGDVAADLKLPSIVFRTSSVAASLAYAAFPRLRRRGLIPPPPPDCKLLDGVPELDPLRFKDLPVANFEQLEGLIQLAGEIGNLRTSSAIIYNTMEFLEQSCLQHEQQKHQVSKIPVFSIGPFHKLAPSPSFTNRGADTSCLSWLDRKADLSVIYISFGTLVSLSQAEVVEIAWGLANSQQYFLWVIRPGSVRGGGPALPEGFRERVGERGCIVGRAPQKAVLAHRAVGGFLSHCGWNSTLESVCEGVPMICHPVAGDQRVNARYLDQVWGVGVELENGVERGEVERAVKRLMQGGEGEEMRQRALGLKVKAAECLKETGSSTKSLNQLVECISSL